MTEANKESKANSIKEKFLAQKRAIEQLKARVVELEALLAGPSVSEISIQSNFLLDQNLLAIQTNHTNNNNINSITIEPDHLLAGEKIKELEILTSSLQDQLRKVTIEDEDKISNSQKENEKTLKKLAQLEGTNNGLQKEVDRLTSVQLDLQSEIRKLKADVSEKASTIEKLQSSQRKLAKNNTDINILQQEKEELGKLLEESNQNRIKLDENMNNLVIKIGQIEAEKAQKERNLRKEIADLQDKVSQTVEKEKLADTKIISSDMAMKRAFQRIAECESTIVSLQTNNTKLTAENVKLMTEMNTMTVKIHELSLPSENVNSLKTSNANMKKELSILRENLAKTEQRVVQAEKRNVILSDDLKRMSESVRKSLNLDENSLDDSIEDSLMKLKSLKTELKSAQKEASDLRNQILDMKSLKIEANELVKKNAELQHNLDFIDSRVSYMKQVVKQLLTSPFNQRQKIVELLVDILGYNTEEKDAILRATMSNGKDLSSRLLYAFEPWV